MKKELDELLCLKYPKIFRDRNAPMTETCMCWGFDIGDGWFNIIDCLCASIQNYIDFQAKERKFQLERQEIKDKGYPAVVKMLQGTKVMALHPDYENAKKIMIDDIVIPEEVNQVVAVQVKEKLGTLRFYYEGGNDIIDGMVTLAESMSGFTCEECAAPAETHGQGWFTTICVPCEVLREKEYGQYANDLNQGRLF